jgi:hypothetical protein
MVVSCHYPKHPGNFRILVDCRCANSQVQPMAGFVLILEVSSYLDGASWFLSLDTFEGFLQFPLESECQEIYSFLTEHGGIFRQGSFKEAPIVHMPSQPE